MNCLKIFFSFTFFLSAILCSTDSQAQFLNANFATNGYTQDVLSYGNGKEIVVQPDNKILVANQRRVYYANTNTADEYYLYCNRYNQDGSLDNSFGLNGIARIAHHDESDVLAIGLQSNGKIIIAGESKYCGNITCGWKNLIIGRINADGSPDPSFGSNGTLEAEEILGPMYLGSRINTVKTLSSGKIIISGVATISTDGTTANWIIRPFVAKLNENGSFDTSFGPSGSGISYVNQHSISLAQDMLITDDGSIFWLTKKNYHTAVVKLSASGVLDANYGTGGVQTIDIGTNASTFVSMDIRDDNKLVLGGYKQNSTLDSSVVITLNSDGSMFNQVNQSFIDIPMDNGRISSVKCVSNNRVLIAGTLICDTTSFANNARLGFVGLINEDGTYDFSFSGDGIVTFNLAVQGNWNRTFIDDMEVLNNGDILCTGGRFATLGSVKSQVLLFSLNSNGTIISPNSLTSVSENSNIQVYPNPTSSIIRVDLDGKLFNSSFSIIDMRGLEVMNGVFEGADYSLDVSHLAKGVYHIRVDKNTYLRFVKK